MTGSTSRSSIGQRREALEHLSRVRDDLGHIPGVVLVEVAGHLGVHPDHLSKMLRQFRATRTVAQRPGSTYKKCLPDEDRAKVAYFKCRGVAAKAYEDLKMAGVLPDGLSLRGFQRRVNEWPEALRACARGGYREMVKHQYFNVEHVPYRGYAYGTDHTKLPIRVLPTERGAQPIWPWLSVLVDLKTRLAMAYLLTADTPNSQDNIDLLAEGIRGWYTPEGVFVGGKPEFLRTDRGGDYISEALSANLINLDIGRQFTEPYSSWQNGRVERLNGTIDRDFAPDIPGFHPGGEDDYTRRALHTPVPVTSLLTLETLDRRLGDFFGEYNNRVHSALSGRTPLEAWAEDDQPVAAADQTTIVNAMSHRVSRRLHHYGIEIRGAIYGHPTLARLRKENVDTVNIRYHEHDRHHIEVFVGDEWACTASKSTVQSEHHRLGVLAVRAAQRREAERLTRLADRQRVEDERARLREEGVDESEWPLLPPDPDEDETAVPDLPEIPDGVDLADVIDSAVAYSDTLGSSLSGNRLERWEDRLSQNPQPDPDEEGAA
ncbi:Mu transposase C-terminal domain-containing protein [Nocardioides seonyuensis]|nr:Mu transposase C-terminal domain-containing protein [Nocardioides seonyuensis]